MIDDKEIDIAARAQVLSKHINETSYFQLRSIEDFKDGARWAINEFLKNLWHPVSEKPIRNTIYLAQIGNCAFDTFFDSKNWEKFSKYNYITRWLYVEDLFPKEGGNHD